jgi:hypothetical protein
MFKINIEGFTEEEVSVIVEAAYYAMEDHYQGLADRLDLSDDVLKPIAEKYIKSIEGESQMTIFEAAHHDYTENLKHSGKMNDTPETQEAVELYRQGKINIFDEMARLEIDRNQAREESLEQARLLGMSGSREAKLLTQIEELKLAADLLRANLTTAQHYIKECILI